MHQETGNDVTFLFTDIVGSTRHWERNRPAMSAALARHDAVLEDLITQNDGEVFKTVGDAFCAAFTTPASGVRAALAIQQAMAAEMFDQIGQLQVRTALHTGPAEARDDDYFGPVVNRVARLLAIGHGGQVLLSRATADQVQESLPDGATLRDLGGHRLKDLDRPERVYQLVAAGLPDEFPPLSSLDARPNNLPSQLDTLIGREKEVQSLVNLLTTNDVREVTISGPGGIGKTRLALAVGAEASDAFPDGVWFVDLGPLTDPALVLPTISRVLGVPETTPDQVGQALAEALRDDTTLLILDTMEHIVEVAPEISRLLAACPYLKLLVTSRVPLRVRGEREFRLEPLTLPAAGDDVDTNPAVRLFVERVRAMSPTFTLTDQTRPIVAAICNRMEGLPLALELAAARTRTMSLASLLTRLDRRLPLLTEGARDAPERQHTIRATIDWSYDLLTAAEQALFRHLSILPGGCTLTSAETLWNLPGREADRHGLDVLSGIDTLVAGNLLNHATIDSDEPRFRMLDLVREYGETRLEAQGEAEDARRNLADWIVKFAADARAASRSPEQVLWLDRLEAEHNNIRAALTWLIAQRDGETTLRLVHDLVWFWHVRGFLVEGYDWCKRALSLRDTASPEAEAVGLIGTATITYYLGENMATIARAEEGLTLLRPRDNPQALMAALNLLAVVRMSLGEFDQAAVHLNEAIGLVRQDDDRSRLALLLHNRGMVAQYQGLLPDAASNYEESLSIRRAIGDQRGIMSGLWQLGNLASDMHQHETALRYANEALAVAVELRDPVAQADIISLLAITHVSLGDLERARELHLRALDTHRQHQSEVGIAADLQNLAEVATLQGNLTDAATLLEDAIKRWIDQDNPQGLMGCLSGAVQLAQTIADHRASVRLLGAVMTIRQERYPTFTIDIGNAEPELRAALTASEFNRELAAGMALPFDEAIATAQAIFHRIHASTGNEERAR